MKIIVITGPESSGKTTLARNLAAHFEVDWVTEYAREYLEQLKGPYHEEDLLAIAQGHDARIWESALHQENSLLICDTDLTVLKIWSEVRYGSCHPWISDRLKRFPADLYLLCRPDIPWSFDPLREHPEQHDRAVLFNRYEKLLKDEKRSFVIIEGQSQMDRLKLAIGAIFHLSQ